jgi:hypothetical protein
MTRTARLPVALVVLALVPSSACVLYGGGDDDCDYGGGAGEAPFEPNLLRDPGNGQCVDVGYGGGGGGGGGGCDVPPRGEDRAPAPDWGACDSECNGLDESTCLATPRCRAAYVDTCPGCETPANLYFECWAIAPSGPIAGSCAGLDAQYCSQHDDCSAVHLGQEVAPDEDGRFGQTIGSFEYCAPEPSGCFTEDDCGPGLTCNADELCLPPPGCTGGSADGLACPSACYGYCVPEDGPAELCYAEVACDIVPPSCPAGTRPGVESGPAPCYTGHCVPLDQCVEGVCPTTEPACGGGGPQPVCSTGTVPGTRDGCPTGYCIPEEACEVGPAPCALLDEAGCVARPDCVPYYQGQGCSCDGAACTCEDWVFEVCSAS